MGYILIENGEYVKKGLEYLREMLEVLDKFQNRYELMTIGDHIYRMFDLILTSTLISRTYTILNLQDDKPHSALKLDIIKIASYLVRGLSLFDPAKEEECITSETNVILGKLQSKFLTNEYVLALLK